MDTRIIVADFTNPNILPTIVTKIDEFEIDIGVLVNNVGLLGGHAMPFLELEKIAVLDIINVNVTSATHLCHSLLPKMIAKGRGAIINLSSVASHSPCPYYAEYAATKHYLTAFTQALASEYSDSGVTIQCVEPGQVETEMTKYFDKVFIFSTKEINKSSSNVYSTELSNTYKLFFLIGWIYFGPKPGYLCEKRHCNIRISRYNAWLLGTFFIVFLNRSIS